MYFVMKMQMREIAKLLGSLGGKARAKSLTTEQKKQIALLGAKARALSFETKKRIETNFRYYEAVRQLRGKPTKVLRIKTCKNPLPIMQNL